MFDNGDGRVHWNRCEEVLHIIRCDAFPFTLPDGFDLVYKVLSILDVMRGMPFQWPEDVSQLLGHPVYEYMPARYCGPQGMSSLCILDGPRNFWGSCLCWVKSLYMLFLSLDGLCKFISMFCVYL